MVPETTNKAWVERTAKMLDKLSRYAVARLEAPGCPPRSLRLKEYVTLVLQAKDKAQTQPSRGWFNLHFKRHLEEAIGVVKSHPVIQEGLRKSNDKYLGVAILNTGFSSHTPHDTIEDIIQGAVRRMLVCDALTAAQDLDRLLVLGETGQLPGYEITLVRGLKLANRMKIEDGLFAIPCNEPGGEWFVGTFFPSGAYDAELTGALIREFEWGGFLQSDPNASWFNPVFRCVVDPAKLLDLFSVTIGKPLEALYRYRCVPQWMQDFGYAGATDYTMYNFSMFSSVMDVALAEEDVANFRSLWSRYRAYEGNRLSMERAVEHLSRALARVGGLALQDKILDIAIALETVYTSDARTEIAHRLSTNAAFFLGLNPDDRMATFNKVKRFYDVRSRLAHGNPPNRDRLNDAYRDGFDAGQKTVLKLLDRGAAPDWDNLVMSAGES